MKKIFIIAVVALVIFASCESNSEPKGKTYDVIYKEGDRGPAGGYIFYDCDADNNDVNNGAGPDGLISSKCGWRFLEAAPIDLYDGYEFGGYEKVIEYTSKAIGSGKSNTEILIKNLGSGSYAAKACREYTYKGYDDWFLPSYDELKLMFENLCLQEIGRFRDDVSYGERACYWSSSTMLLEDTTDTDKEYIVSLYAKYQCFGNGLRGNYYRQLKFSVRPIRSF